MNITPATMPTHTRIGVQLALPFVLLLNRFERR